MARELRVRLERGGVYVAEEAEFGVGVGEGELYRVSGVRGGVVIAGVDVDVVDDGGAVPCVVGGAASVDSFKEG